MTPPTDQLALGETEAEQKAGNGRKGLDTEEVRRRLAKRHEWPEWLFFEEVPFDGPDHRMRLADCIALPTYASRGYLVHGFEIKVTRSDWLRELKEGAKAEAIAKDVDRFWLVLGDASIASDDEVPPAWGVMVPNGESLRVRRQAKHLRPDDAPMDRAFLVTLARKAQKMANDRTEKYRSEAYENGYKHGREAGHREAGDAPAKVAAYDAVAKALDLGIYGVAGSDQIERAAHFHAVGKAVLGGGWRGWNHIARDLDQVAKDAKEEAARIRQAIKEHIPEAAT